MWPRGRAGGEQSPTKTPGGGTMGREPGALCCREQSPGPARAHSTTCMAQAGVKAQGRSHRCPCPQGKGHPSHLHQPQPCDPSVPIGPHPVTPPSPATP